MIEVALALGISGFALIAIFGLIPIGINNVQNATRQTTATSIASAVAADLRQTPTALVIATHPSAGLTQTSPRYGISIYPVTSGTTFYTDDSGAQTTAVTASSTYRVYVNILSAPVTPAAPPIRTATIALVQVSWPPQATPIANAAGSVSTVVGLDTN